MVKNHYVYYSYEEWGRGYIGVRSCLCLPEEDTKYFGSFKDKTFIPTKKIILQTFHSRKEALNAEIVLHSFYDVGENRHFANRAKQTSVGFNIGGFSHSEETKAKLSRAMKGREFSEEHRHKISEAKKRENISEKYSGEGNPMFGRTGAKSPIFGIVRSRETRRKMSEAAKKSWDKRRSVEKPKYYG